MFDVHEALKILDGQSFTASNLYKRLEEIHREHLAELPGDFRSKELFEFAVRKGWFKESEPRQYKVCIR